MSAWDKLDSGLTSISFDLLACSEIQVTRPDQVVFCGRRPNAVEQHETFSHRFREAANPNSLGASDPRNLSFVDSEP